MMKTFSPSSHPRKSPLSLRQMKKEQYTKYKLQVRDKWLSLLWKYILLLSIAHFITIGIIGAQPKVGKHYFESHFSTENQGYISYRVPPVIGAWFWGEEQFKPDGYKEFIDKASMHSSYNLLTTGFRIRGRDITDIDVHNQLKLAVEYANEKGIKIALELDPRIAVRKFEAMYPDELQESLWLEEIPLSYNTPVDAVVRSISLNDHMTGSRTPYISLKGSLKRVYAYRKTAEGIDRETLKDITGECEVVFSSSDSMVVRIPGYSKVPGISNDKQNDQLHACVMATYTHLAPDVFAPHLIEFTRNIIKAYADIPLAGAMRDEWGFPPSFPAERMASGNHFWYSQHYAAAYAEKTGGRELLKDCLLMFAGIKGKEQERIGAINHYMELNWQQNKILEEDFYQTVKHVFGENAAVVTHSTWFPYPNRLESKINGLFWWVAKRDWAQTDEITPVCVRTALSKKWNSPVWYNQFYSANKDDYTKEIWSYALAGGRINYHPLYPNNEERLKRHTQLFNDDLVEAENKIGLLNFISNSPLDCPVAVVFGHPATMNPASTSFEDVGMELINGLWQLGIPTDLIPSSEIESGNMTIDENGWIKYGPQQYAAVVLYNPEFEKKVTVDFFNKAASGQSKLFRIGDWTMDFEGNPFDGNVALPKQMIAGKDTKTIISAITKVLKKQNIALQTPATRLLEGFGYVSNVPPLQGFSRLIDGTVILISGKENPAGDVIRTKKRIGKETVHFDAVGVAAVRLDKNGQVQALAAGGLKYFKSGKVIIELKEPIDLAFWKNENGDYEGIIQGYNREIPEQLLAITGNWTLLKSPAPLNE